MNKKLGKTWKQLEMWPGSRLWQELAELCPLLALLIHSGETGWVSLKLAYRGTNDVLAVAKRYPDQGPVEVIFGSGTDVITALVGLENAIDQDKWRPDKYAK